MGAKRGHAGERGLEQAHAVQDHGCARMACRHQPPCQGWLGGSLTDCREAAGCQHPRDQAPVRSDLGTGRVWLGRDGRGGRGSQRLLLGRGMVSAPQNDSMTGEWCGIADIPHNTALAFPWDTTAPLYCQTQAEHLRVAHLCRWTTTGGDAGVDVALGKIVYDDVQCP